jgi:hypothetical protein
MSEGLIQVAGLLLKNANGDVNVCVAEYLNASSADEGIGIGGCDNAAGDTGFNERVGAGTGSTVVAAGFEGDIGGGSEGGEPLCGSLFEGDDLGVIVVVVEMRAFADDLNVGIGANDDTANLWVGTGEGGGLSGELESPAHEELVLRSQRS